MKRVKSLTTAELNQQMEQCWTIVDVAELFGVSRMTVHNWTVDQTDPLPAIRLPGQTRGALRFVPSDTVDWGRRNNKRMTRRVSNPGRRAIAQIEA